MTKRQKIYLPFKRLIDIFGSIIGIIVCFSLLWWWILPINAIVVKGNPIFARHRIGKNDKPFRCIKFRSMKLTADPHIASSNIKSKDEVTGFGNFLRKTSFDETLQLLNILVGQMSFIGPRPLIDVSDDIVTIEIRRKNGANLIKPGISGYAQIHGRTQISAEVKADFDGYYFDCFNFWFDFKIFVQSFLCFFAFFKNRGE